MDIKAAFLIVAKNVQVITARVSVDWKQVQLYLELNCQTFKLGAEEGDSPTPPHPPTKGIYNAAKL